MKRIMPGENWWLAVQELDLPLTFDGVEVWFVEDDNGTIRLLLEIGETTPVNAITRNGDIINKWKQRLLAFQGAWKDEAQKLQYGLWLMKRHGGKSYRQLADDLNRQVGYHLTEAARIVRMMLDISRRHNLSSPDDALRLLRKEGHDIHDPLDDFNRALTVLKAMGLSDQDAEEYCFAGVRDISDGKPVFSDAVTPIDKDLVAERVHWWDKKIEKGKRKG